MIQPVVLASIFYGENIAHLFDDAHHRPVARRVRTDSTHIAVRQIITASTIFNITAKTVYGSRHAPHLLLVHAQHVQGKPQGSAPSYSRQAGELPHRIIKQFRHLVIVWPLSGLLVLRNDSEVNRLSVPQSRQAPILCCRRQSLSLSNRRTTTAPPPSSPRAE